MPTGKHQANTEQVARYADMLAAMGTESRLRIMQLLLTAHPDGMVVGDIAGELNRLRLASSRASVVEAKANRPRVLAANRCPECA